jgi:hypothetical protein
LRYLFNIEFSIVVSSACIHPIINFPTLNIKIQKSSFLLFLIAYKSIISIGVRNEKSMQSEWTFVRSKNDDE